MIKYHECVHTHTHTEQRNKHQCNKTFLFFFNCTKNIFAISLFHSRITFLSRNNFLKLHSQTILYLLPKDITIYKMFLFIKTNDALPFYFRYRNRIFIFSLFNNLSTLKPNQTVCHRCKCGVMRN